MSETIIADYETGKPLYVEKTEGGKRVIRTYDTNTPLYRVRNDAVNADNEEEQTNP